MTRHALIRRVAGAIARAQHVGATEEDLACAVVDALAADRMAEALAGLRKACRDVPKTLPLMRALREADAALAAAKGETP